MKYENSFVTSDYCLASTLVSLNFSVIDLDRSDARRIKFVFHQDEFLTETINEFRQDKIRISPLSFHASQKYLKSLIYGGSI